MAAMPMIVNRVRINNAATMAEPLSFFTMHRSEFIPVSSHDLLENYY
jgi:hypothetical protein